ncbi:AMP-binding protein [uncultured Nitratireductor sp.]|uniref:AMP-binding protein n=1 Tax=uncultured Nitratireductor sp. TaxID=520953 RepID=UPI0025CD2358|nr:AMP-binding protein [uncultured Nitratireductor sp.]
MSEGFIDLLCRHAADSPERIFARHEGIGVSFADLERASAQLATAIREKGIKRGDRIAVAMRNSPFAMATIYAITRAGNVWVPVNVALKGEGLEYILGHSDPSLIVADEEFAEPIAGCSAARGVPLLINRERNLPSGDATFDEALPQPDDAAAIMYTSGTTGPAKGVIVTHRMLRLAAEAVALCSAPRAGDDYYVWEPFYHIGGAQTLFLPLVRDVTLTLGNRFSASRFWQDVSAAGSTHIHHLGGVIQILLKQPPSPLDRGHNVRIAWGGGCATEVWRAFEQRFGIHVRECYGMTEASSLTTYNDTGLVGSVGKPMPWFSVRLLDDDGRESLDERGEIVITTSVPGAIFPGYFRNPEATAKALCPEGFRTGDIGSWDDDGNLFFHGRKSDSVRCRGENVSSWEVEHVAGQHPDVEDSAMIGVATDVGEQDIKLFVQLKPGATADADALGAWLEQRLAGFQVPRYIAFVKMFERTPSQRIMKHRLSNSTHDCWDRMAATERA